MSYKIFWLFLKGFAQKEILVLLLGRAHFSRYLVLVMNVGNHVHTGNLRRNLVKTKIVQEKGYFELVVYLSILFVQIFVHTRECNLSNQVGVEHVFTLS